MTASGSAPGFAAASGADPALDAASDSALESAADYRLFRPIPTRWLDNDAYGHVNNVVFYSWFDTAVNTLLIDRRLLDVQAGAIIGLVVESGCRYFRSVAFPETIESGLRIARLGSSSIRWEIGLFSKGHATPAAAGFFVHVYVDRVTRRPVPLPAAWRDALAPLIVAAPLDSPLDAPLDTSLDTSLDSPAPTP